MFRQTKLVLLVAIALTVGWSTAVQGSVVTNITASLNGGPVDLFQTQFVSADSTDPTPHFSLATLNVQESAVYGGEEIWWADLEITVTRDLSQPLQQIAMIAIDKDVINNTGVFWTDFHMELIPVNDPQGAVYNDSFKDDPAAVEKTGTFDMAPSMYSPRSLWWEGGTGQQGNGQQANYWMGINVDFGPNDQLLETRTFTLRQHASVPEPTSILMFGVAMIGMSRRKRTA